jgi:hypothetical protein
LMSPELGPHTSMRPRRRPMSSITCWRLILAPHEIHYSQDTVLVNASFSV